jgi:hypothetical protein
MPFIQSSSFSSLVYFFISPPDRLSDVEKRIESTNTEFEEAKQSARKAVESFQIVKERRCQLFMKAFDHISKVADREASSWG